MPEIPLGLMYHKLHISSNYKPVKHKPCRLALEKAKVMEEKVQKLLTAGAIRETEFPEWISNPMVIHQKNDKCSVCIDFTDLNKACPKDNFPLPMIYQLVDSAAGHKKNELP